MKEISLSFVRHLLTTLGGAVAAKGTISSDDLSELIGWIVAGFGLAWGIIDKMLKSRKAAQAASTTAKASALVLLSVPLLFLGTGCASILPDNDPVVVNAERTTSAAVEMFDTFLKWEYDNRETLDAVPEIGRLAELIRANGQAWLKTSRTLTGVYKENRTDDNKANLQTAVAVLTEALSQAKGYILRQ